MEHFALIRRSLWHSARRNFYYADDIAMAASICGRLIARFPFSEEADEAKLLLHDIGLEYRKSAGDSGTGCLYCPQDLFARLRKCVPCGMFVNSLKKKTVRVRAATHAPHWDRKIRISIAVVVTALPILGVAGGGVIGIVLPEITALLTMASLFWCTSRIRTYRKKLLNIQS